MTRWRGLKDLVVDAVHHGATAVEQVHQQVARKPFEILALVPPLATPARCAGSIQSAMIASTYGTIRAVNRFVGAVAGMVMDLAARGDEERAAGTHAQPSRGGTASGA